MPESPTTPVTYHDTFHEPAPVLEGTPPWFQDIPADTSWRTTGSIALAIVGVDGFGPYYARSNGAVAANIENDWTVQLTYQNFGGGPSLVMAIGDTSGADVNTVIGPTQFDLNVQAGNDSQAWAMDFGIHVLTVSKVGSTITANIDGGAPLSVPQVSPFTGPALFLTFYFNPTDPSDAARLRDLLFTGSA